MDMEEPKTDYSTAILEREHVVNDAEGGVTVDSSMVALSTTAAPDVFHAHAVAPGSSKRRRETVSKDGQAPVGKKTKGRQRIEIRRIEDKAARQVAFSKRKSGIWKKTNELALRHRVSLAVVVFSEAGKAFAFASPSVDAVLGCGGGDVGHAPVPVIPAAAAAGDVEWEALEALCQEAKAKAQAKLMRTVGKKVAEVQAQAGRRFWWEAEVEALGEEELPVLARALQRLRDNVRRRADKMTSAPLPP